VTIARELLYRFSKSDPFLLADKPNDITTSIATEAVIKVSLRIDGEGGSLLFMEGTEANEVGAFLSEFDSIGLDDLDQIMRPLDGVDFLLGYLHGHVSSFYFSRSLVRFETERLSDGLNSLLIGGDQRLPCPIGKTHQEPQGSLR
jgi:hypothetical protein